MSHTAEIIAVGTELLLGNIANTNAQELSQALSSVGINVYWHTVVGDNPTRLAEAVDIARRRADVILTTGGLGPTYDDLTKQTVCAAFGLPLVFHPEILEGIRAYFEKNVHAGKQPPPGGVPGRGRHLPQQRGHRPRLRLPVRRRLCSDAAGPAL